MTSRRTILALLLVGPITVLGLAAPAAGDADPVGVWPLRPEPTVERGFDPPDEPWGAGHRGADLLGQPGQPVRSALPGRVSWAGVLAGRGVVVVAHEATRTTYEPVEARVFVGDIVAAGEVIGRLSSVGSHCLPRACLHWGWIREGGFEGDTYLDPLRLVGGGPVRLLPLWRDQPVRAGPLDLAGSYLGWRAPVGWLGSDPSGVRLGGVPAGTPVAAGPW